MKKRIYLVQTCDKPDGFTTLPYSIGVLAAYAWQNVDIRNNYELCDLIVDKTPLSMWDKLFIQPDVIAFSCYIWNYEYNKRLAQYIKNIYPDCIIIFGGHSIPINNSRLLLELPFVNYLIHGEGEIPFQNLLLSFIGYKDISEIPNISYINGNEVQYKFVEDVMVVDYPSPYLNGFFDKLVNDPSRKCSATLETNRGCPFKCAYCDWGLNHTKLRMMDLDKIYAEIEWMGKKHIYGCNGADSNFGMFQRDELIAQKIADTKLKYGYPKKFSVSFSKESNNRVLKISEILHRVNALAGVTLSFQSLNSDTLEIIGRKNLSLDYFKALMALYNSKNIPTYSEIILGLPGETYDSFVDGLCSLIELGQYRYINVYNFTLLPNSSLGQKKEIEKYNLKTVKIPSRLLYCKLNEANQEFVEHYDIVIETSTMSRKEWISCRCFTSVIKGFHSFGIMLYIATFLYHIKGISYRSFYESLSDWISHEEAFPEYLYQRVWYQEIASGNRSASNLIDIYCETRIPEEEAAFLKTITDIDNMYNQLKRFVLQYGNDDVIIELFEFQREVFNYLYTHQIRELRFHYDFIAFFNGVSSGQIEALKRRETILSSVALKRLSFLPKIIYVSK